ncbi:MAG: hypothetical protein H0X47_04535 [Nitrospirales bacterium]|nr:hypothetical protein [Nitrospirales bacterium]
MIQTLKKFNHVWPHVPSYERRKQEWELANNLANQDKVIDDQQVVHAQDHVRVVEQERVIAELQTENAEQVVDFLMNKFTNVELYDWVTNNLEQVHRFFLQHATAIAQLAERQLAFERQEAPPPMIQRTIGSQRRHGGLMAVQMEKVRTVVD